MTKTVVDLIEISHGENYKKERALIYTNSNVLNKAFIYKESFGNFDFLCEHPEVFLGIIVGQRDSWGNHLDYITDIFGTEELYFLGKKYSVKEDYVKTEDGSISKCILTSEDGKEKLEVLDGEYVVYYDDGSYEKDLKIHIYKRKEMCKFMDLESDYDRIRTEDILNKYYDEI